MKKDGPEKEDVPGQHEQAQMDADPPAQNGIQSPKDTQSVDEQQPPSASLQGPNPPVVDESAGDGEDTGVAAGAEQPPATHVAGAPQHSGAATPPDIEKQDPPASCSRQSSASSVSAQLVDAPRLPSTHPHRRDSDSDGEKGLKRKLADRTVSERLVPEDVPIGRNGTTAVGAMKRPRDDAEADPNTREKKRPTPPPDEEKETQEAKPVVVPKAESPKTVATPKFVSIYVYLTGHNSQSHELGWIRVVCIHEFPVCQRFRPTHLWWQAAFYVSMG